MAYYRDNVLQFAGINQSKGVPMSKLARSAEQRISPNLMNSATPNEDVLKLSATPHYTKAYKDGLEYLKAEKDNRAKERYLDGVTPGRNKTVNVGTSTSTSELPIPDAKGNVYNYTAQTTAQTGMMFEAPWNLPEVPAQQTNVMGRRRNPTIRAQHKTIVRDPFTNATQVVSGSASVIKPPVTLQNDILDPVMPGGFPQMIGPVNEPAPSEPPEVIIPQTPVQSVIPEQIMSTVHDPTGVQYTIESAQILATPNKKNNIFGPS
ncbi:hypothetical protein HKX48_007566 [Thoreauomyces humboldtii]|nr:hypothetical protein HKX48_007566 [Thoreauomyces humboldtii]